MKKGGDLEKKKKCGKRAKSKPAKIASKSWFWSEKWLKKKGGRKESSEKKRPPNSKIKKASVPLKKTGGTFGGWFSAAPF